MFCNIHFCRFLTRSSPVLETLGCLSRRGMAAANGRVAVRKVGQEDSMELVFTFTNQTGADNLVCLKRPRDGELGSTIGKIKAKLFKHIDKKTYRKVMKECREAQAAAEKLEELSNVDVRLFRDSAPVNICESNEDVWVPGTVLQIDDASYSVELNVPKITSMKLPKTIVSGFPCLPKIDGEFYNLILSNFEWFVEKKVETSAQEQLPSKRKQTSEPEWEHVKTGPTYTPTNADIGKRLRLVCTPHNPTQVGDEKEAVSRVEVSAGPGPCPFENRHAFTTTTTPEGQFRVVTYNVLADTYASTEFSQTKLFGYCPNYALDFDYRKFLLLKELRGYNADIICLQECDERFFRRDLSYVMENEGMKGAFLKKYGEAGEGEAIFYRTSKFKCVAETEINITETLKTDPTHADLWKKLQSNETMINYIEERTNCLQTTLLESMENNDRRVLVATTHLFFHPKANLIRIVQTEVVLKHLETLLDAYEAQFGGKRPSVILCGDLNSSPSSSVIEYVNTGMLPEDCRDYFDENQQRTVPDLELRHKLQLNSGCGFPEFTNFTVSFKETLDYVFIDSATLKTSQVIPMPSIEELSQFDAIPSVVFPSDHIALVCDLAFKDLSSQT